MKKFISSILLVFLLTGCVVTDKVDTPYSFTRTSETTGHLVNYNYPTFCYSQVEWESVYCSRIIFDDRLLGTWQVNNEEVVFYKDNDFLYAYFIRDNQIFRLVYLGPEQYAIEVEDNEYDYVYIKIDIISPTQATLTLQDETVLYMRKDMY